MKKILIILFSSLLGILVMGLIILAPILMLLNFFGSNVVDDYVEGNFKYANSYKEVVRKNLIMNNGYVSLNRILYFYLADESLNFEQIYEDNLDQNLKQVKPISEVCSMERYKDLIVCSESELSESGQIDVIQNKPFNSPLEFFNLNVSSFFMEERIVYNQFDVHEAWDFSTLDQTPVYSVCDGIVDNVSFKYNSNIIDKNGGAGNYITIKCKVDDIEYKVLFGHLYPHSTSLKVGDRVLNWQQIATVGTTGYSTGSHLHYQVYKDNVSVDGLSLIDFTNINN